MRSANSMQLSSMDSLKQHLVQLSDQLPSISSFPSYFPNGTLLTTISQTFSALLVPSTSPSLYFLPTTPKSFPTTLPTPLSINLPSDSQSLLPGQGMLAILGPRSITVIDTTIQNPSTRYVALDLFQRRPSLKLIDAAWSPHAPAFLLTLTSDGYLRLFDVVSEKSSAMERSRVKVVTVGADPVAISFGRGVGWNMLSVYVLARDGNIYVAAPFAPIGTRMAKQIWRRLWENANRNIKRYAKDEEDTEQSESRNLEWSLQQARMQKRFLEHVFEQSVHDDDMIAVREFKPAPVLFQGPLFVEHDDTQQIIKDDQITTSHGEFTTLITLHCASSAPPILLRATDKGQVSVLISLEKVEAQWFLSHDATTLSSENGLVLSEEYSDCAKAVAPLLLCFEHLSIENRNVKLFLLGGKTDSDILFGISDRSVYSIRLSFASVVGNANALEKIPMSSISEIFSTELGDHDAYSSAKPGRRLLGIAAVYARGEGPVGIILNENGKLHATPPVRWIADIDNLSIIPSLLGSKTGAEMNWELDRTANRKKVFVCPETGEEVMELLEYVQTLQNEHGAHLAPGTLGNTSDIKTYSKVLDYLDDKIAVFTGGSKGAGIGDSLNTMAKLLMQWSDNLKSKLDNRDVDIEKLKSVLDEVSKSEDNLKMKLNRVEQVGKMLHERLKTTKLIIESENSQMNPTEIERFAKLKEKKRRLLSMKKRIEELTTAVEVATRKQRDLIDNVNIASPIASPARHSVSFGTPLNTGRKSHRWSASPSWRGTDNSLSRKLPERSPRQEGFSLNRKELQQIKLALEKHSKEIAEAMEMTSNLWKRLAAT